MRKRFRAAYLQDNAYGTKYPSPTEKLVDVTSMNGGLNMWELDYKLNPNQSPDLVNVYWQDGSLSSRPGQAYVFEHDDETYGAFYACYEREWGGYIIAHKGSGIYKIAPRDMTDETGTTITEGTHTLISGALSVAEPAGVGHFFVFGDKLYYMNGNGDYLVINDGKEIAMEAKRVEGYIPTTLINYLPNGTGGDINQDENRIQPKKKIQYNGDNSSTTYVIPSGYLPLDATAVLAEETNGSKRVFKEKLVGGSATTDISGGSVSVNLLTFKSKISSSGTYPFVYSDLGVNGVSSGYVETWGFTSPVTFKNWVNSSVPSGYSVYDAPSIIFRYSSGALTAELYKYAYIGSQLEFDVTVTLSDMSVAGLSVTPKESTTLWNLSFMVCCESGSSFYTGWYNGKQLRVGNKISLSDYGITLTGTPAIGNTITVVSNMPSTGDSNAYYEVGSNYYIWNGTAYETTTAPTNYITVGRDPATTATYGKITFSSAPASGTSNVDVTLAKTDEDTLNSILKCTAVTVYGGDLQLGVVCGGTPGQPNAYFWSGNNTYGLDPTYFPFDYYNYAGASSSEYITGFGKQQSMLVIFKEKSIGKSYFEIETVKVTDSSGNVTSSTDYLKLPYKPINDNIGCDLGESIRLINNNLVFANTEGGVYVLLDSTAYGENTVKRISRNINGDGAARSVLTTIEKKYSSVSAFPTTGEQGVFYYVENATTGEKTYYVWDDSLSITSTYTTKYRQVRIPAASNGLLYDLRYVANKAVSSFDDGQRYWICARGNAYLWDYSLGSYQKNEENISWFFLENIYPKSWFSAILSTDDGTQRVNMYGKTDGSIVKFVDDFNDFMPENLIGSDTRAVSMYAIPRRYTFATQYFQTYEVLKDVLRVVFAVRSDTDSAMTITYKSDYELRADLTPIRAYGYRLSPRDLTHRSLHPMMFAGTAVRKPRCFHVRHFAMTLTNNSVNTDMSLVSAQIIYRYSREDR